MANYYLVATGNWSDASVWSATSGGSGGAGVPTINDVVSINQPGSYTVTLDSDANAAWVSLYTGRLNFNGHKLTVGSATNTNSGIFGAYTGGSPYIDMTNGTLIVNTPTGYTRNPLQLSDTGLTFVGTGSRIVLNINKGDSTTNTLTMQSLTFNDVEINLGTDDTNSTNVAITGSPTFRALTIQSANSAAHTVVFDSGATFHVSKVVLIGSSAANKLTIKGATGITSSYTLAFPSENFHSVGTFYAQYINVDRWMGFNTPPILYAGTNSTDATGHLTLQDPPKASTLVDPLSSSPSSNTNWQTATAETLPSTTTTGHAGAGYRFGSKQGVVSTNTYDLIDNDLIFELPPTTSGSSRELSVLVGWFDKQASWDSGNLTGVTSAIGFEVTSSSINPLVKFYSQPAQYLTYTGLPTSVATYVKLRISSSTGNATISLSNDGTTWSTSQTTSLAGTPQDLLYLKSSRIMIGSISTATTTKTTDIGSVNPYFGPTAPTASFAATPTSGRAPLSVAFTDTSSQTPTSWSWNFGDSTTSTLQNPTHTYSTPGTYSVSLTATNSIGSGAITRSNYITSTATVLSGAGGIPSGSAFDAAPATVTLGVTPLRGAGGIPSGATFDSIPAVITPGPRALSAAGGITSAAAFDAAPAVLTQLPPPPPPPTDWSAIGKEDDKVYTYKVYKSDGTFVGVWTDVNDLPEFTQQINTPGTTTTVQLSRSADRKKEVRDNFITDTGDTLITDTGDALIAVYQTNNTVGPDTDVELNYNVDIYVNYGGYDVLVTSTGEHLVIDDGEDILVGYGAPNGVRIFSGFILDYKSSYSNGQNGVTVTLASNGFELAQSEIRSGTSTTVSYSSQPIETTVKSILDTNPGRMTYTNATIGSTGVSAPQKFQLNTKLDGISTMADQTPSGWYWFGNPADNNVYLLPTNASPDHTFILGWHIKNLDLIRSMENLKNRVYFVGGDVTPGDDTTMLFKKYEDTTSQSQWRVGLDIHTDARFTLATSTALYANKLMARYSQPIYTSQIVISSARYDLESIRLGETIGFRNFDNFVDSLVLQIVSISYSPYAVTLQVGEILETQSQIITDTQAGLDNAVFQNIPTAPS